MNFSEIKAQEEVYVVHSYGRVQVALEKGKNATAWDADGKKYVDFTSGIGVNALGFCDEGWQKAVTNQIAKIQHISNYYYNSSNTKLAMLLSKVANLKKTFFCNSGAEANECAIKTARKYGERKGAHKIITLDQSFHGRTKTTLAATGQDSFHQEFQPLTEGFLYAQPNDIESVKALIDETVCAVMIETVQGEGGVNLISESFIKDLRMLCDSEDILLVLDEVQTGIGRTGSFFSYQEFGVLPDILTCAKGLAGGLPIGICMMGEKTCELLQPGMHGSTFGGNPVSCAAAIEVVERVNTPEFLESVKEKADYFRAELSKIPQIKSVCGRGLMLGMEIEGSAVEVMKKCAENGLLVLTAKTKIRFLPPLTITKQEIDEGLAIFKKILA